MAERTPLSRRDVLAGGGATLTILAIVPACDRLRIESAGLLDSIPAITPTKDFYVYQCCGKPDVDPATWTLSVRDRGTELVAIDAAFLEGLDPIEIEHTLQCIGSGPRAQLIGNAMWSGLPLVELFSALDIEVDPDIVELRLVGADDYSTSIPIEDLDAPVWLIWGMNGEPLPYAHGGPARLLVPGRYGIKNPKWITTIELIDEPYLGHWEESGWSNEAVYQSHGFIASPPTYSQVEQDRVRIIGTAYAGTDPIARVEVSKDGGASWDDAKIAYGPGANVWTIWYMDWTPKKRGSYTLKVRATTESGVRSSPSDAATDSAYGYDGSMEAVVQVV